MADDRSKRGREYRRRIAAGEPYDANYFRRKHVLSKEQAERIIKRPDGNRQRAKEQAQGLSSGA